MAAAEILVSAAVFTYSIDAVPRNRYNFTKKKGGDAMLRLIKLTDQYQAKLGEMILVGIFDIYKNAD